MKASKVALVMGMVMLLLAAGCNQKKGNAGTLANRQGRGAGTNYNQQGYFYTASTGQILPSNLGQGQFEEDTKLLLSPTIKADQIGEIDENKGVSFQGYIEVDASGNVIPNQSSITITVRDSFTGQDDNGTPVPPLFIYMKATGGRALNGQVELFFSDSYGSLTMRGQFQNGGQFTGNIAFQNNAAHGNGSSPNWAEFRIQTCGFFRCQQ